MAAEPWPVLPDHLIEDILARLPAKSAHRCRCLSRAWAAALSSEGFADRHFRLANRRSCPKILFLQGQDSAHHVPEMHMWSPEHPGGATLMEIPRDLAPDHFSYNTTGHHVPRLVTRPCRGLVILQVTASDIYYVCNPSTGQMAALPEGRPTGGREHMESNYHRYASLRLGYDSCTRKHKVVRIYYRGCNPREKLPASAGCEIYVVNSTGLWRPPKGGTHEKPAGWANRYDRSVFAHGHIYWLAQPNLELPPQENILFFSLDNEKFGTMALPSPLTCEKNDHLMEKQHLTELDGCPCLLCADIRNGQPRRYHLWLLRRHEAGTWDLHCQIDLDTVSPVAYEFMYNPYGISSVATIDNGRRILFTEAHLTTFSLSHFKLCAYDPATRDIENLVDATGFVAPKTIIIGHVALYEESMHSPGQRHKDITFAMSLVLQRLPVHAPKRLMCVCRSWRTMITMIESNRFNVARR
ncbi:hypothetical protein VPH35_055308 [Triticum aestivum]